jgi:hypothetical protein
MTIALGLFILFGLPVLIVAGGAYIVDHCDCFKP